MVFPTDCHIPAIHFLIELGPCSARCPSWSLVYTRAPASVGTGTRVCTALPADARLGMLPTREALLRHSSAPVSPLLELSPQAIYISMFLTDMKIETFFWSY